MGVGHNKYNREEQNWPFFKTADFSINNATVKPESEVQSPKSQSQDRKDLG